MFQGMFYIFNQTYLFLSLLILIVSVWLFGYLKNSRSFAFRISLISASGLSFLASMMPSLAMMLTISFTPVFIYHLFPPLTIAPFVVGMSGLLGTWSTLLVWQEFFGLRQLQRPPFQISMTAMLIFIVMGFKLSDGFVDYHIFLNSQNILSYAASGENTSRLQRLYSEVSRSHDQKIIGEVLIQLSQNSHASPKLLKLIYLQLMAMDMEGVTRNVILLNLSKNTHTSSDVLKKIMLSVEQVSPVIKNDAALEAASSNPNFSHETLLQLTTYPDCEVRRAMIAYPKISENVLNQMIVTDPDVGVKHDARRRLDFLHGLSRFDTESPIETEHHVVASQLVEQAKNSNSAAQLAGILKQTEQNDDAMRVFQNLAGNCFIDTNTIHQLFEKALSLKGYARTAVLFALSVNPVTPVDILRELANEKDLVILRGLVSNPNLPVDVATKFSLFPDCKIRKEIICMSQINNKVLNNLRHDTDESVAFEAMERMRSEGDYLHICREMQKLTPSCQKYFSTEGPDLRSYPNTSAVQKTQPVSA